MPPTSDTKHRHEGPKRRLRMRREALESVRQKIDAGLASLDRGEGVPAEDVVTELEAQLQDLGLDGIVLDSQRSPADSRSESLTIELLREDVEWGLRGDD